MLKTTRMLINLNPLGLRFQCWETLNLTCFTNGAKRRAASELMVVAAVLLEAIDLLRPPPIALKKTWDCVEGVNAVRVG